MDTLLELKAMYKYFPGVCANKDVNLNVKKGEIHALLGENGAGKTTLMNCVYGLYTPEKGEIFWKNHKVSINSIKDAINLGIGMVHQHFMLVENMTVLENIMLGLPSRRGIFLDKDNISNKLAILMDKYGLHVDLQSEIWQLSVGTQQKVEIIKVLYRQAELIILDEPTAVLTPDEVETFFTTLRLLKEQGHSIIIITHKLEEVTKIADTVSVLRGGEKIKTIACSDTDENTLASMMIGREFISNNQRAKVPYG
ncbi:MAG: ATP-binding cassette domain-containing protein, partial [Desulfosporosinus sp.]|nr:ATP-binding cassette domain-containing protein [Desulfosporosinus sp.]